MVLAWIDKLHMIPTSGLDFAYNYYRLEKGAKKTSKQSRGTHKTCERNVSPASPAFANMLFCTLQREALLLAQLSYQEPYRTNIKSILLMSS